jgi:hypothetical protein
VRAGDSAGGSDRGKRTARPPAAGFAGLLFIPPRLPVLHFAAARLPLEMQWLKSNEVHAPPAHIAFHYRKAAKCARVIITCGPFS